MKPSLAISIALVFSINARFSYAHSRHSNDIAERLDRVRDHKPSDAPRQSTKFFPDSLQEWVDMRFGIELQSDHTDKEIIDTYSDIILSATDPDDHERLSHKFGEEPHPLKEKFKEWMGLFVHGYDENVERMMSSRHSDDIASYRNNPKVLRMEFEKWTERFDKKYDSAEEKVKRMMIWINNHLTIEKHNKNKDNSYMMGHNQFSDLTHGEFLELQKLGQFSRGVVSPMPKQRSNELASSPVSEPKVGITLRGSRRKVEEGIPVSVNWVEKGAVTAVKNQGRCGSCWAFSAVGAIEGLAYLKNGKLANLSVQEFLDCDPYKRGCVGGLISNAFVFDEGIEGICSDEEYPYLGIRAIDSKCRSKKCRVFEGTQLTSFVNVTKTDAGLMEALTVQPVSAAIQASGLAFQFYKSGVMDEHCGKELDHGILVVGYGSEEGEDYWLVKNSWGLSWGDEGYIKLARGPEYPHGQCGIHMGSSRPVHKISS